MNDFIHQCETTVLKVQDLLKQNPEWKQRYASYSPIILENIKEIKENKKKFREWAPLYLYMTISEAKGSIIFSLRYLGQDVAKLKVGTQKQNITISTAGFDENNKRDFECDIKLDNCEWKSKEASYFRQHFILRPPSRTNNSRKSNNEHRLESLLLTEFAKKNREHKFITNIQPVKLAGHARFQMPTPLAASDMKTLKYANSSGGGVDIISRIGIGKATKLCIMEVKDENGPKEPPTKVIQQGLAYATFIRELLRSKSGKEWWELFGFKGKLPESIEIYVVSVMPSSPNNNASFNGAAVNIAGDHFYLHSIFFQEEDNKLSAITSSLPQCKVKDV